MTAIKPPEAGSALKAGQSSSGRKNVEEEHGRHGEDEEPLQQEPEYHVQPQQRVPENSSTFADRKNARLGLLDLREDPY